MKDFLTNQANRRFFWRLKAEIHRRHHHHLLLLLLLLFSPILQKKKRTIEEDVLLYFTYFILKAHVWIPVTYKEVISNYFTLRHC